MLRTQSGQIMFRFLKKEEAKAYVSSSPLVGPRRELELIPFVAGHSIGAMDSEEKLVLDYIKDAGNLGKEPLLSVPFPCQNRRSLRMGKSEEK